MHKKLFFVAAVLLFALPFSNAYATCRSSVRGGPDDVSHFWRAAETGGTGWNSDVNRNLADYGVLFEEARTDECSAAAAAALYKKIKETLANDNGAGGTFWPQPDAQIGHDVGPYGAWLEGTNVGLIYVTALELLGRGNISVAMDALLMSIDFPANVDGNCGFANNQWRVNYNSCMEDYALNASGWAWKAAYQRKTGRGAWQQAIWAREAITNALSPDRSVCIVPASMKNPGTYYNLTDRGMCIGSVADLANGAVPVGLHNGDAIPYGLGLMTAIASAAAGMDVAGAPITLYPDEITVAEALRKNGREHVTYDPYSQNASFNVDCLGFSSAAPGQVTVNNDFPCAENYGAGYKPKMFPVYNFYNRYLQGQTDNSQYDFSQWDGSQFCCGDGFWNPGRKAYYQTLTQDFVYDWQRPPLTGSINKVSIRTWNGNYLSVENGGGGAVNAIPTWVLTWETLGMFDINGGNLESGDVVQFQTDNGRWLMAENAGGASLRADPVDPQTWEMFYVYKLNGSGPIVSGDTVAVRAFWYPYYMVAEGGGGGAVNVNRTAIGPWEQFVITRY